MPDAKEVFQMVSEKASPDQGALRRQHELQDRRRRRQRVGTIALSAAVIAALAVFFSTRSGGDNPVPATQSPAPSSVSGYATTAPALVGLDGSIRPVTLASDAWEPALSQDGKWIAYVTRKYNVGNCGACTPGPRIAAVRVVGTGTDYVTFHGGPRTEVVGQPVWPPDGSQVAYVASGRARSGSNIFVVDADGSLQHALQLTTGSTQKEWPSWSPDGTQILYSDAGSTPLDDSGFSSTQELYRVAANGTGASVRITKNGVDDSEGVYSPDGAEIVLFHDGTLAIMNADGSGLQDLGLHAFSPRWSPDGKKIAFLTYNATERFELSDPSTGSQASWPRLDVNVFDRASGTTTSLGVSVASDTNAVSWTSDSNALLINRASNR